MLRYLRFENVHTDIFTPRTYQVELLHKAIGRNTIVCLGSGTGKTFISVLLIKELAHQLRKPVYDGGKRTFYLVQKVAAAEYREKALQLHTDLDVLRCVDEDCQDPLPWDRDRWQQEITKNQVFLLSPAQFQSAVVNGHVTFDQINALVFDSCHHVVEDDHPYMHIMKYYYECPLERPPRILGLTASLLNHQCKTPRELHDKLLALQNSLDSTAETASDVMLAATFGTKPREIIVECEEYVDETGLVATFENIIANALYFLENCNFGKKKKDPQENSEESERNIEGEQAGPEYTCYGKCKESSATENESQPGNRPDDSCQCKEQSDLRKVSEPGDILTNEIDTSCQLKCLCSDTAQSRTANSIKGLTTTISEMNLKGENSASMNDMCVQTNGTSDQINQNLNNCDMSRSLTSNDPTEILPTNENPSAQNKSINNDGEPSDGTNDSNTIGKEPDQWQLRNLEEDEEVIKVPRIALLECYNILHLLGPWCAGRVAETLAKQVEKLLDVEKDEWTRRFLNFTHTQLNLVSHMMTDIFDYEVLDLEDFLKYVSPKVRKLLETFYDYKPNENFFIIAGDDMEEDQGDDDSIGGMSDDDLNEDEMALSDIGSNEGEADDDKDKKDDAGVHYVAVKKTSDSTEKEVKDENLCGLVFVERRHTAFILNKLIEEMCNWDPDLYFVRSHHFTGQGYTRGIKKDTDVVAFKKQEEVLRKFRHREHNLLVSTGVLEEGLDIPRCNLVVRFDAPHHYRSYVQSKGRARAANSRYYLLVNEGEREKFDQDLETFKGFEKLMCHALQELDEEREEELGENIDQLLSPYVVSNEESSAQVTLSAAIAFVNRYCAKLPSDAFTHLVPDCSTTEIKQPDGSYKYKCSLQLPINSPVKRPIQGEVMNSKKLAKMAVALKACEVLHKEGELDDQFLPIGKEMIRYEDEDNEWEETEGQARPGTTKRKQYYLKKIANALLGRPVADKPCYMYALNMTLTAPITEEQNTRGRQIYAPENTPRCFGFLSESKIPLVPHFPVFTRSGEVTISVDLVQDKVTFTEEQLSRFEGFHKFVFNRVLRLDKDPMKYAPKDAPYSCIVIPILKGKGNKDITIDWKFIEKIENCPLKSHQRPQKFVFQKREQGEKFVYRQEDFEDAVVMPSYRNIDQPQYFYVAETRHDINPKSPFPSPELYDTFQHYYSSKYGLEVTNPDQPLLDVDHTSARLNLLTPRYMNQKGVALPTSSAETRRQKRENLQQKQILVPELCDVHPFPASLWRKAVCIPAIFYRLNYLLIADEIRILIASQAKIGVVYLPYDHRFPQLEFNFPELTKDESSASTPESKSSQDQATQNKTNMQSETEVSDNTNTCSDANSVSSAQSEMSQSGSLHSAQTQTAKESQPRKANSCDSTKPGDKCNISTVSSTPNTGDNTRSSQPRTAVHPSQPDSVQGSCKDPGLSNAMEEAINQNSVHDTSSTSNKKPIKVNSTGNVVQGSVKHDNIDSSSDNTTEESSLKCHVNVNADNCDTSTETDDVHAQIGDTCTSTLIEHCNGLKEDLPNTKPETCSQTIENKKLPPCDKQMHLDLNPPKEASALSESKQAFQPTKSAEVDSSKTSEKEDASSPSDFISFDDEDIDLEKFVGPSPCLILQTLTMSNANDFFNLERLETIGDSFLKFAITVYLYCTYPGIHEGKLSYLRSKQVSNYNLYRLGKKTGFPECMVASKFEPSENWLPPGFVIKPVGSFRGLEVFVTSNTDLNCKKPDAECFYLDEIPGKFSQVHGELKKWEDMTFADVDVEEKVGSECQTDPEPANTMLSEVDDDVVNYFTQKGANVSDKDQEIIFKHADVDTNSPKKNGFINLEGSAYYNGVASEEEQALKKVHGKPNATTAVDEEMKLPNKKDKEQAAKFQQELDQLCLVDQEGGEKSVTSGGSGDSKTLIPYNLQTQHSLPDKSIADCVEALIGCYLVTCGQRAALQFMAWLGLKVLPEFGNQTPEIDRKKSPFCGFQRPPSPLLMHVSDAHARLDFFLDGYSAFEEHIQYIFTDKSYLLQAFTHASYHYNNITDCYQRLEFLGDAILDYVITRHLFEDSKKHSPGILTDLRSALVNNNIFAALAVKWDFHKYFKAVSPHLFNVINKFVQWQKERGDVISLDEEFGDADQDDGKDEGEDIEIPKALGDIFESVAGAVYLDSGMSLDVVWRVYSRMMKPYIDAFTEKIPKSPVRELLEMEPETAKFERPERTMDGKIRVTVTVVGKGSFRGVGRNYRIAKSAAAKRALKHIKHEKEMARQIYLNAMMCEQDL